MADFILLKPASAYEELRAFFSSRGIQLIDSRSLDTLSDSALIRRYVIDGKCVLYDPTFDSIQWQRTNISLQSLMEETCTLLTQQIGSISHISYFEAFQTYVKLDPFTDADCSNAACLLNIDVNEACESWDREKWLSFLFKKAVQPHLESTLIFDFPPLSHLHAQIIQKDDVLIAEYFEIYYQHQCIAKGMLNKAELSHYPALNIGSFDLLSVHLI